MAKNTNFEQFSGPGAKYAPKTPRKTKPPVPFAPVKAKAGPSAEDGMRATLRQERKMTPNPRAQSTDHMN